MQALQSLQGGAVFLMQHAVRYMNLEVWIDSDQLRVESRVMCFRERDAVLHHRLPELLVLVLDDMRGVEQHRLAQARQRAAAPVRRDHRSEEHTSETPVTDVSRMPSSA